MDANTLKTIGQIAGIGGLAIGAFIWLFRDLLQKANLPQLTRKHLTLIISFVFAFGVIGIAAWVWIETRVIANAVQPTKVEANCGVAAAEDIKTRKITITGSACEPGGSQPDKGTSTITANQGIAAKKVEADEITIETNKANEKK
ncbi:hypothetical protein [Candidatus Entotheonella palauensis]|uniref:hypothetical protein n=1 Tax=Candidatus Entotheonella palauensis TaxID=93172 RepID=UPI000B7F6E0B|nr:hypothetical protein [Candidatus Entotheonella palauensis]